MGYSWNVAVAGAPIGCTAAAIEADRAALADRLQRLTYLAVALAAALLIAAATLRPALEALR